MEIRRYSDFSLVLQRYLEDFPECERKAAEKIEKMMKTGKYRLFIAEKEGVQGYALSYHDERFPDFVWMDYFAVAKEVRGSGVGSAFLKALIQTFKRVLLEVEISDGVEGSETFRRENFYKRLGAERIPIPYELPTEEGSFPMNLFTLGEEGYSAAAMKDFIVSAVRFIHSDYPHTPEVIQKYIGFLQEGTK